MRASGSFRHEYEQYREHEIESYKASVPREALLAVGDQAVARLRRLPPAAISDLVLCDEVDRIIARRLKLPGYRTWRRLHMAQLALWRTPAHWALDADTSMVRELVAACDGEQVLLAGIGDGAVVLFAAALGCAVTALGEDPEVVGRVVDDAEAAGLGRRVCVMVGDLDVLRPEAGLRVAVCSDQALARVPDASRGEVVDTLQRATLPGGVHVIPSAAARADAPAPRARWLEEVEGWYERWQCTWERTGTGSTFVARKDG